MEKPSRYRWYVVAVFFGFTLLHQTDRLLIGPLTEQIRISFKISDTQMGLVSTGALVVGAVLFPIWGYLYDRYSRAKLLALASFIWGSTTWLGAIAPTYPTFLVARASTGIDDSSYPGLYSLIADYFGPLVRGRVYGLLQITQPLGYLMGMILAIYYGGQLVLGGVTYAADWRRPFYLTGTLGVLLAFVIYFFVKEPKRGQMEPEMAGLENMATVRFNWDAAASLFKIRTMILIYLQGFFGVFPWNAITFWFFAYLERERGYSGNQIFVTMALAVIIMAIGYPLGGALGDYFFKRNPRGRIWVSTIGVFVGAALFFITLNIPIRQETLFLVLLCLTSIFVPFASSNVVSTIYDVTVPEIRSTANAVESFIESIGAALAPLMVGMISDKVDLKTAFLSICTVSWIICGLFFLLTTRFVSADIAVLRGQMRQRADQATHEVN
jgi:MFS transporter, Spinster family, sphingosine-1-phosphate transporter